MVAAILSMTRMQRKVHLSILLLSLFHVTKFKYAQMIHTMLTLEMASGSHLKKILLYKVVKIQKIKMIKR